MNDGLAKLLLRRSEGGGDAVLWGSDAEPHFGRAFDRLLATGLLIERAPATTWAPCRLCEGECGERGIIELNDGLVAECPHYPTERTRLTPHDVRSFSINVSALVTWLTRGAGFVDGPELIGDDTWLLGQTSGGRFVFLVLSESRLSKPDGLTLIASRASLSEVTILVPETAAAASLRSYRDAGCHIIAASAALAGDGLGLNNDLLAPAASRRARLVINRAGQEIILDGRKLALTDQSSQLLIALAEKARRDPGFLSRHELEMAIYGDLRPPAARTLSDVVRVLRDQMSFGLTEPEAKVARDLIENRRVERYRLTLPPEDIQFVGETGRY
ncbi:MAG: hypothetical protein AB7F35_01795 [Acetobacteraceae bacterium]